MHPTVNYSRSRGPNTVMNGTKINVQDFCMCEKIMGNLARVESTG